MAWITRGSVWLAWAGLTLFGGAGLWLLRGGYRKSGLGLLAFYGALGCYGLGHYSLATLARHTAMMNFSIWFEAVAGLLGTAFVTGATLPVNGGSHVLIIVGIAGLKTIKIARWMSSHKPIAP